MSYRDATYGFGESDARDLIASINGGEGLTLPGKPPIQPRSGGVGGGPYLFGFILTADVVSASVSAVVYELDGESYGPSLGAQTIYDPFGWYAGGKSGSRGACYLQAGKYYALQSACPPPEEE